jgi:hypothetical protein
MSSMNVKTIVTSGERGAIIRAAKIITQLFECDQHKDVVWNLIKLASRIDESEHNYENRRDHNYNVKGEGS